MAISAWGDVLVAGRFELAVDFDAGAGVDQRASQGHFDAFVTKYADTAPAGPCDADRDGDVDLTDFAVLARCISGPANAAPPPGCLPFDFIVAQSDRDNDLDLNDVGVFQRVFTGTD